MERGALNQSYASLDTQDTPMTPDPEVEDSGPVVNDPGPMVENDDGPLVNDVKPLVNDPGPLVNAHGKVVKHVVQLDDGTLQEVERPDDRATSCLISLPCVLCGTPFGPNVDEVPGMAVPQQLNPCGHSLCASCIQSWETQCNEEEAPVACPVCHNPVRDIVPNHLYCDLILEIMRTDFLHDNEMRLLMVNYKQHMNVFCGLIGRDCGLMDVIVSLRAAAEGEHKRAELLAQEVETLRQEHAVMTEELEAVRAIFSTMRAAVDKTPTTSKGTDQ